MTTTLGDISKIINLEPRAAIFTTISKMDFLTFSEMAKIMREKFPGGSKHLTHAHIKSYLDRGLPNHLIEETEVSSMTHGTATARKLSEEAESIVPLINFVLPYLPENFGLSSYCVLGNVSTSYDKGRGTDARIKILQLLSDGKTRSLAQINEYLGNPLPTKTHHKLTGLSSIVNIYGKPTAFISYNGHDMSGSEFIYSWTGKHENRQDFRYRNSKMQNLLRNIIRLGESAEFTASTIHPSGFKNKCDVNTGLSILCERGYLQLQPNYEARKATITEIGESYIQDCILPVERALNGDSDAISHINNNKPTQSQLEKALDIYIRTNHY